MYDKPKGSPPKKPRFDVELAEISGRRLESRRRRLCGSRCAGKECGGGEEGGGTPAGVERVDRVPSLHGGAIVVFDTLSDSIQCLNFAKK